MAEGYSKIVCADNQFTNSTIIKAQKCLKATIANLIVAKTGENSLPDRLRRSAVRLPTERLLSTCTKFQHPASIGPDTSISYSNPVISGYGHVR